MAKPVKPTVPDAPLRSQPDTFSARAEASIVFWATFATYLDDMGDFTQEQANAALAAALGADLPSLSGKALQLLRVNAGETAAEFAPLSSFGVPFLALENTWTGRNVTRQGNNYTEQVSSHADAAWDTVKLSFTVPNVNTSKTIRGFVTDAAGKVIEFTASRDRTDENWTCTHFAADPTLTLYIDNTTASGSFVELYVFKASGIGITTRGLMSVEITTGGQNDGALAAKPVIAFSDQSGVAPAGTAVQITRSIAPHFYLKPDVVCKAVITKGSNGALITTGDDRTLVLNTLEANSVGVTLVNNQLIGFTAGEWHFEWETILVDDAVGSSDVTTWIYDVTGVADIISGMQRRTDESAGAVLTGSDPHTFSATSTIELRARVTSNLTNGYGMAVGPFDHTFTKLKAWKVG